MVCDHLRHLYQLCTTQQIRLSSSELVHFVCKQCDAQDTCPSNLMEYADDEDEDEDEDDDTDDSRPAPQQAADTSTDS